MEILPFHYPHIMNIQRNVPVPRGIQMHTQNTDLQNRWYCYEIDRYGNRCRYRRDDISNHVPQFAPFGKGRITYFQWDSVNANNGAEPPFRYRYWITDENDNTLFQYNETPRTQTDTISLPIGTTIEITLQVVDRIGTESKKRIFQFVIQ